MIILLTVSHASIAQFPNWDKPGALADYIGDENIHSVQLAPMRWPLAPPIISLGRMERLKLTFDYLGISPGWLRYRFIHCDRNWQPSDITPAEYLKGFEINSIEHFEPSISVWPGYTHYELTFPNRDVSLMRSGNYVIQVVHPYEDTIVLLQRQFAITEDAIIAELQTKTSPNRKGVSSTALQVNYQNNQMVRSPDQLHVYSKQNWYDPRYMPLRYDGSFGFNVWTFGSIFPLKANGLWSNGAEWRILDLRTLEGGSEGIDRVYKLEGEFHVEVTPDEQNQRHSAPEKPDLNGYWQLGQFDERSAQPNSYASDEVQLTSQYVYAYFALKLPKFDIFNDFSGTPILVIPGVAGAERGVEMTYSATRQQYEVTLYLKQGVYNYRYGLLTDHGVDFVPIEGSYKETENEYHILCYYRGDTDRTDRLISHLTTARSATDGRSDNEDSREDKYESIKRRLFRKSKSKDHWDKFDFGL